MVQTPSTPQAVLELAMKREEEGHQFYFDAAAKTSSGKGRQMFQWLAQQETKHYEKLDKELKALGATGQWRPAPERDGEEYPEPVRKGDFPSHSEVTGEVKPKAGELDALHVGIAA